MLAGPWSFAYQPEADAEPPTPPEIDRFVSMMPVPGWWDDHVEAVDAGCPSGKAVRNPEYAPARFPVTDGQTVDASLPFVMGVGWYRQVVEASADWARRSLLLQVGGVAQEAWIYIDRELVAHHVGPSTAFDAEVTGRLRAGQFHELLIAVSNLRSEITGCGLRGYHGKTGGITGPISLRISGRGRASGLHLWPGDESLREILWRADLFSPFGLEQATELRWRILEEPAGEAMAEGVIAVEPLGPEEHRVAEWHCGNPGLTPWSPDRPKLYHVEVDWVSGGTCIDRLRRRFGLRRLVRDGTNLRLNGKPVQLRGMCDHYYFPVSTMAPREKSLYAARLQQLKAVGYNFVRFHTWVPPQEYMEAADEVGMLLQPEKPVGLGIEEWTRIVRRCRSHPSVISYCYGNEEVLDEEKIEEIEEAYAAARAEAPDCLVMPMQAMRGIEYVWQPEEMPPEITVEEPFPHVPRRLESLGRSADLLGHYSWGLLSYLSLRGRPEFLERRFEVYKHPLIAHEIGISGSYPDLDLAERYTGRIPSEIFDGARRLLVDAGREEMAQTYHRNSCRWQWAVYKRLLETLRRCDRIKGYDMLGAVDCHWHHTGYSCGVLNEFYELKAGRSAEDVFDVNGPNVLLLDYDGPRNVHCGSAFSTDVMVSQYSGADIPEATLTWALCTGQSVLAQGVVDALPAPDGRTATVGQLELTWPAVEPNAKVTLHLELASKGLVMRNHWDFWVFADHRPVRGCFEVDDACLPALAPFVGPSDPSAEGQAPVRVVPRLSASDLDFLDAGGDVLLLGCDPLPSNRCSFQIAVAGRSRGNLATVVREHPALGHIPHEGWCDWQFARLMDGRTSVFNGTGIPFDPIVEVVSSYKDPRWQALLWEARVGRGRLMATGCHLAPDDPAAGALLRGILEYMTGGGFRPAVEVGAATLKGIRDQFSRNAEQGTAMAYDTNAPQNRDSRE